MKLRMRGNTVRVRLTRSEVAAFGDHGFLEEITDFGNGQILVLRLASAPDISVGATFIDGRIEITLPEPDVRSWAASDQVAIKGGTQTIELLVEKDFTCLTPRDGDEDHDTFPHPREPDRSC